MKGNDYCAVAFPAVLNLYLHRLIKMDLTMLYAMAVKIRRMNDRTIFSKKRTSETNNSRKVRLSKNSKKMCSAVWCVSLALLEFLLARLAEKTLLQLYNFKSIDGY